MRSRRLALGAAVTAAFAISVPTALAAGAPPPPTAAGGQAVTQIGVGMKTPTAIASGGGAVFAADGGSETAKVPDGGVYVLKHGTARKLAHSPVFAAGLAWHRGSLYISGAALTASGPTWELSRWSGWNGTSFAKRTVLYTAPRRFQGFNGIAFGPDGRLYVGADVGLTNHNDHGPASTSPDLYEILSFSAAGTGMKVFASGIRQPWQMVFPTGSRSPLVSDLGPDSGPAKDPLDAILKVRAGQDYGFPGCTPTTTRACSGAPKPFKTFSPHTDIMGLAIIGRTLYMSSFLGSPAGKTGEVLSMPLAGGAPTPFLTGFVAPVVGLGTNGHTLYVGELTGQVFSVMP